MWEGREGVRRGIMGTGGGGGGICDLLMRSGGREGVDGGGYNVLRWRAGYKRKRVSGERGIREASKREGGWV